MEKALNVSTYYIIIAFLIKHLEATHICEIADLPAKYRDTVCSRGKSSSKRDHIPKVPRETTCFMTALHRFLISDFISFFLG